MTQTCTTRCSRCQTPQRSPAQSRWWSRCAAGGWLLGMGARAGAGAGDAVQAGQHAAGSVMGQLGSLAARKPTPASSGPLRCMPPTICRCCSLPTVAACLLCSEGLHAARAGGQGSGSGRQPRCGCVAGQAGAKLCAVQPPGPLPLSPVCTSTRASALQKGYSLMDRVVRAADVGVAAMPDEQELGEPDDVGGSP